MLGRHEDLDAAWYSGLAADEAVEAEALVLGGRDELDGAASEPQTDFAVNALKRREL